MFKFKNLKKVLTPTLSIFAASIVTPIVFINNIGANTKAQIILVNNNSFSLIEEIEDIEYSPITIKITDTYNPQSNPTLTIWNNLQLQQEKHSQNNEDNIQVNKFTLDELYVCGDSISAGFALSNNIAKEKVFTKIGIPCIRMFEKQYTTNSKEVNLLDSLKEIQPKYLLLIYGTNDLGYNISADKFSETYMENIAKIREVSPDTVFFVGSIPPIDSDFSTNSKIIEFNKSLKEKINNSDNVIFVDYHSKLLDSEGKLDKKYNSGDGIHLTMNTYNVIMNCISY